MAFQTIKRVSVPNLKSSGPTKTELLAKEVGEFSIMLCGKMGWGRFLTHHHKCMEIFKTLNSLNFCFYWCIDLKLARDLSKWGHLHCVKILSKNSLIQIFDDVIANHE